LAFSCQPNAGGQHPWAQNKHFRFGALQGAQSQHIAGVGVGHLPKHPPGAGAGKQLLAQVPGTCQIAPLKPTNQLRAHKLAVGSRPTAGCVHFLRKSWYE